MLSNDVLLYRAKRGSREEVGMPAVSGVHHVSFSVSEEWYGRIFGLEKVVEGEEVGRRWSALRHPGGGLLLTLVRHDRNSGEPGSELRTGLDHVSFAASGRSELEAWVRHLDRLGIAHSGVTEAEPAPGMSYAVVVFRDPDNIQLEIFTMLDGGPR
jgi:glyoxylase I family protein